MEKDTIDNIFENSDGTGENSTESTESSDSNVLSSSSEKCFYGKNQMKTENAFIESEETSNNDGILRDNNIIRVKINNLECAENSDYDIIVPANKKFVIICTLCKKPFFKMSKLKKHLRIHAERKVKYKSTVDAVDEYNNVRQQSYYSNELVDGNFKDIKIETDIIGDNVFKTMITTERNNPKPNGSSRSNTVLSTVGEEINRDDIKMETDIADLETRDSDDECNDARGTKEMEDSKCAKSSDFDVTRPITNRSKSLKICNICNKSFFKKFRLRKHMKVHMKSRFALKNKISNRPAKKFKCSDCNKCFTALSTMKMHVRILHTEKQSYKCNICDKSFSDTVYLKRHVKYHDEKKPHKCKVCQKSFPIASSLRIHMNVHTGVKPWRCDICEKSYSDRTAFKKHMQHHNEGYSFKCNLCNHVLFNRKTGLSKHIKTVHSNENPAKKRFGCKTCEKYFSTAFRLKRHARIHTGEKQFVCDICKKSFVEKGHLKRHITIVHAVKKRYECDVCKKLFSDPEYFKIHATLHTNKKPFECDYCAKSFSHKKFLKCHLRDIHDANSKPRRK